MNDPYTLLGLDPGCPTAEVKRAFRRLAMQWHPDRNPTREAEERFKHLKAAYELILDPERLAAWEAEKRERAAEAGATDASDEGAHRTRKRGRHATDLTIELGLEEAAAGCTQTVSLTEPTSCPVCAGSGRVEHAHSVACPDCGGIGRTRRGGRCGPCAGRGYVRATDCSECAGEGWTESVRRLELRIPPGMLPGEQLRLARQRRARDGTPAGDVYVEIMIRPHELFRLEGRDLACEVPVGIFQLLAGATIIVPTLKGRHELDLSPYPQHNLEYRIPGLGFPGRAGRPAGQLRLHLQPVYPLRLDAADKELLARLHRTMAADGDHPSPELAGWERRLAAR